MISNNFDSLIKSVDAEFDLFRAGGRQFSYFPERLLELYRFIPVPASEEQIQLADKAIVKLGLLGNALASKGQKVVNAALGGQEADSRKLGHQEWRGLASSTLPMIKDKIAVAQLQKGLSMLLLGMEFFRRDRAVLMIHLNQVASELDTLEYEQKQSLSRKETENCSQILYQELAQKLVAAAESLPLETREETLTIALAILSEGHQSLERLLTHPSEEGVEEVLNDITEMMEVLEALQKQGMPVPKRNLELLSAIKEIFSVVRTDQQVHLPLYRFFGRFLAGKRERVEDQTYFSCFSKGQETIAVEEAKCFFSECLPQCLDLLTRIGFLVLARNKRIQDHDVQAFTRDFLELHLGRFKVHEELYLQADRFIELYQELYLRLTPSQQISLAPVFLFAEGKQRQFPTPEEFRAQFFESTTKALFAKKVAEIETSEEKWPLNINMESEQKFERKKSKKKSREEGREEQVANMRKAKIFVAPPETLLQSIVKNSTFPFKEILFADHVTQWKTNPSEPLSTADYAHLTTNEEREEQIFRHNLPSVIYKLLGTEYSVLKLWSNPRSGENDDVYVLRANLKRHGETVRGEIRVCFKKGTNRCYHSYFHRFNTVQMVENMLNNIWQPIDFPTFEEAEDLKKSIPLVVEEERGEELRLIGPKRLKILSILTEDGSEIQLLKIK